MQHRDGERRARARTRRAPARAAAAAEPTGRATRAAPTSRAPPAPARVRKITSCTVTTAAGIVSRGKRALRISEPWSSSDGAAPSTAWEKKIQTTRPTIRNSGKSSRLQREDLPEHQPVGTHQHQRIDDVPGDPRAPSPGTSGAAARRTICSKRKRKRSSSLPSGAAPPRRPRGGRRPTAARRPMTVGIRVTCRPRSAASVRFLHAPLDGRVLDAVAHGLADPAPPRRPRRAPARADQRGGPRRAVAVGRRRRNSRRQPWSSATDGRAQHPHRALSNGPSPPATPDRARRRPRGAAIRAGVAAWSSSRTNRRRRLADRRSSGPNADRRPPRARPAARRRRGARRGQAYGEGGSRSGRSALGIDVRRYPPPASARAQRAEAGLGAARRRGASRRPGPAA